MSADPSPSALYAAAEDELDLVVVALLYTLASRVSEMCAADVTDRIERGRRSKLDVTRKEGNERILALSLSVAELLDTQTASRTDGPLLRDRSGARLDAADVDWILTRLGHRARVHTCPDTDRPAAPDEPRHAFKRCERCRDVTPPVMRVSRITHMLDRGVDLVEVQGQADQGLHRPVCTQERIGQLEQCIRTPGRAVVEVPHGSETAPRTDHTARLAPPRSSLWPSRQIHCLLVEFRITRRPRCCPGNPRAGDKLEP